MFNLFINTILDPVKKVVKSITNVNFVMKNVNFVMKNLKKIVSINVNFVANVLVQNMEMII